MSHKINLLPNQFRFGKSAMGIVVGFSASIWNIKESGLSFSESDVQSRWSAGLDGAGKMKYAYLTFWWKEPTDMELTIPFIMTDPAHRQIAKEITSNRRLNFVNTEDLESNTPREAHYGLWADVADFSMLDWLEIEGLGFSIKTYRAKEAINEQS